MPLKMEPYRGESGVSYLMQGSFGPRESAHQLDNTGQHVAIVVVTTVWHVVSVVFAEFTVVTNTQTRRLQYMLQAYHGTSRHRPTST